MKICSNCARSYPETRAFFHYQADGKNGFMARCIECKTKHDRDRYKLPDVKKRKAHQSKEWARNNPEKYMIIQARSNAKARGIEFTITKDDIDIPAKCPLLGIEIIRNVFSTGRPDNMISIDRVDSDKGYIPGNVKIISFLANKIKTNATPDQIKRMAENIDEYVAG